MKKFYSQRCCNLVPICGLISSVLQLQGIHPISEPSGLRIVFKRQNKNDEYCSCSCQTLFNFKGIIIGIAHNDGVLKIRLLRSTTEAASASAQLIRLHLRKVDLNLRCSGDCTVLPSRVRATQSPSTNEEYGNFDLNAISCEDGSADPLEDEICIDPLSDLQKYYDNCTKDPGHMNYKSCDDFTMDGIPESYRTTELLNVIKTLFFLTVQVVVKDISSLRPTEENYNLRELYEAFGTATPVRFGSGKVNKITKISGNDKKTCPCLICRDSEIPYKKYFLIEVITARHVVYDIDEAMKTECTFGYTSYDCKGQTLSCVAARVSPSSDWCKLKCVTHDVALVKKLKQKLESYKSYSQHLYEVYRCDRKKPKLAIIISHPHGCYKQISVGFWRKQYQAGGLDTKYTYTTSTCKGSSGAPVFILGRDGKLGLCTQIHSGWDPKSSLKDNFSCCVFDYN
ncbi:hypothetical protein Btru_009338 [Bulinus truncatus]|nr:hypothetical protein Btru_009338 [Bulinus truncatus]